MRNYRGTGIASLKVMSVNIDILHVKKCQPANMLRVSNERQIPLIHLVIPLYYRD